MGLKILGLDPSTTATGWCIIDMDTLEIIDCGAVSCKYDRFLDTKSKAKQMAIAVVRVLVGKPIDCIGAEVMESYPNSPVDPNKLAPIWLINGAVIGTFIDTKILLFSPKEWGGSVKKVEKERRNRLIISKNGQDMIDSSAKKAHLNDVWDACGIALKTIKVLKNSQG